MTPSTLPNGSTTEAVTKPVPRSVAPWGLVDKDELWYVVAGTDAGQRTFRVERIVQAQLTDIEAERPAGFDLSREWDRVVEEVERRRSSVSATVLVAAHLVPVLRAQFGRHCEPLDELDDDGRVRVRVAAPMALSIAETLAGWGAAVEVLEPLSVQDELARIGAELVQRYEHG